jgi:hypothetical protein
LRSCKREKGERERGECAEQHVIVVDILHSVSMSSESDHSTPATELVDRRSALSVEKAGKVTVSSQIENNARWKDNEELILAKGYVKNSMDPKTGTDQEAEHLWSNIAEFYRSQLMELHGLKSNRSVQGLKNRWSIINREVSKFAGYYQRILALDESGKTDEDKLKDAIALYKEMEKKSFQFLHVWTFLYKFPKWSSPNALSNAGKRGKVADPQQCNPFSLDSESDIEENIRPMGNKKAKKEHIIIAQEERRIAAQENCYEEMKKKNLLLEETIGYKIFNRPGADPERAKQFFDSMEKQYLQKLGLSHDD